MPTYSGQLERYLKQHADFYSKYHIQPNLLELHREYANMYVQASKPAGFYRFAYGEYRQIHNIARYILCHEGGVLVQRAMQRSVCCIAP